MAVIEIEHIGRLWREISCATHVKEMSRSIIVMSIERSKNVKKS